MTIDSHQHVILPIENQLKLMEEANIDKTILFSTRIHPEITNNLEEFEKEMNTLQKIISGSSNSQSDSILKALEEQKLAIKKYPDKFIGFGYVPLNLSENETTKWIEENVIANNFKGLGEFTFPSGQVHLLDVIFKVNSKLKSFPLWIHTFFPLTLDDISHIVKLAEKHPKTPVILGHLGGFNWVHTIKMATTQKNIYLDISATYSSLIVSFAINQLPERVLFSSDAPYNNPILSRDIVEKTVEDETIKRKVLGLNIKNLLKI